jgi:hypothetical protein
MTEISMENKLEKLAEIKQAVSNYESALIRYLNFQKLNKSKKLSIVIESNLLILMDSNYIDTFLRTEVNTAYCNLKKLEVL